MRRRNLLNNNNGKLVLNSDFLFWFDGKRYLDSSSWYPLILSGDTLVKKSDYYLTHYYNDPVTQTYNSTKGCIVCSEDSHAFYSRRASNIVKNMVPGGLNDFTFITAVDCVYSTNSTNTIYIMASSYSNYTTGRGSIRLCHHNNSVEHHKFTFSMNHNGWFDAVTTKTVENGTHIRTLAAKRKDDKVSFYLNGNLFETINCTTASFLSTNDNYEMIDYDQSIPLRAQDFYGQVAYKSALSDDDINSMHNYFVKYYNM